MSPGRRASLWAPPLLYMGGIFYFSSLSHPPQVGPDTYEHFVEYGVFALTLARAFASGLAQIGGRAVALSELAAVLYGVSDEFHQSFVPGRDASLKDLRQDALGALTFLLVAWGITSLLARRGRTPSERQVPTR